MVKLSEKLKSTPHYWTPGRIKALRKRCKLSKKRFASQLGINEQTIYHWEADKAHPSALACKMLTDFEESNTGSALWKR